MDEKLDSSMSRSTKIKIKGNVQEYFCFIRKKFSELDSVNPDLSEMISLQIKTYYIKQKSMGHGQQAIFENVVSWIHAKTKPKTKWGQILTSDIKLMWQPYKRLLKCW